MNVYIAVKYMDGYRGTEFPPSPLKLIQAIIASSQDRYIDVLSALETQSPSIYASQVSSQYEYARFVINNDERLEHWNTGTKKKDIVRHFNCESAFHLVYEYELSAELVPRVREAIANVQTLGRAGDWAFASAQYSLPAGKYDLYRPTDNGRTQLRVPMQGSVASLFAHFGYPNVPVVYGTTAYEKNPPQRLPRALFELTDAVPAQQATEVVERIRRATMNAKIKNADGHDFSRPRLAIYPLPTLDFNDSMIR